MFAIQGHFNSLITTIVIETFVLVTIKNAVNQMVEKMRARYEETSTTRARARAEARKEVNFYRAMFKDMKVKRQHWVNTVMSNLGLIRDIVRSLTRVKCLDIRMSEPWNAPLTSVVYNDMQRFNECDPWENMPLLELLFRTCEFEALFCPVESLFAQRLDVDSLINMKDNNRFHWLTYIDLTFRKVNTVVDAPYGQSNMESAARYAKMLRAANQLKELHFGYQNAYWQGTRDVGSCAAEWLRDVLSGQYWPHLDTFFLKGLRVNTKGLRVNTRNLSDFFSTHHASLKDVQLDGIVVEADFDCYQLVKFMRDNLTLTDVQARIYIDQARDTFCSELTTILEKWPCRRLKGHRGNERYFDAWFHAFDSAILEAYILKIDPTE